MVFWEDGLLRFHSCRKREEYREEERSEVRRERWQKRKKRLVVACCNKMSAVTSFFRYIVNFTSETKYRNRLQIQGTQPNTENTTKYNQIQRTQQKYNQIQKRCQRRVLVTFSHFAAFSFVNAAHVLTNGEAVFFICTCFTDGLR